MLTLYYEARLGLARGAIFRDGLPHLYLQGLEHDPSPALLGVRSVGRVTGSTGGMCFAVLAGGIEAVLDAPAGTRLNEGAVVEVEITAEARQGKRAQAVFTAFAEGTPRRLSPVLSVKDRLLARACAAFADMPVVEESDRDALDTACEQACNGSGPLPGGGDLSIEVTRGMIACDIDAGGDNGLKTPRAFARACNERACADLPRRLRLSGLGGLVVVDLIGQRHDGEALRRRLLEGFGAEAGRIIVAPIGKFGTLEFTRPWGACPVYDFTPMAIAVSLVWQALRLSDADRSRPIVLNARPSEMEILRPLVPGALDPLAPMLRLEMSNIIKAGYAS